MMMQSGFFDLQDRYQKLNELGDPLEVINRVVEGSVCSMCVSVQNRQYFSRRNASGFGIRKFHVSRNFKVAPVCGSLGSGARVKSRFQRFLKWSVPLPRLYCSPGEAFCNLRETLICY